ncbi:MAG: restriction endonuclease [bacterium]|nr:restriction endonuclease [bacterium]
MTIPDFQTVMRPLLEAHQDGEEHINRDLVASLADHFELTEDERREMLPSGRAKLFANRVGWAKTHISKAGLLFSPRRAISQITERGRKALRDYPDGINLAILDKFKEHRDWLGRDRTSEDRRKAAEDNTPEEIFENAYLEVRRQIEEELLSQVMASSPDFLEQVVVDLVVAMGYGGSRKDAGEALGRAGDEGIDGIIKEDPLGLDIIYLQAKRWDANVSRPEIQKFAGALQGQRARKGIFITTSGFSAGAIEYVSRIETKIILIDGPRLAKLMYDHGIGVSTRSNYELRRIDTDYFSES